ncbi:hypothetical protein ASPZODRAFT_128970 [Penicilliopsis zonata CBS 506.65]|uniref:Uncharacterized protein n=1 Tax=Penicilliopsis zonata CBS 506.65 TaxID=1073090 RepID=A0A1L9STD7_9EURO|nr:hypothetical protein ASPZODRAFT_128970 [Penicilliopsis zonata CBS 506.65]OJJ50353.1 hypothetical protein ASPZODRAFT_128970 [Penicilliopsis zonata CBS 506.65]
MPLTWFSKETIAPGTTIQLNETSWTIVQKINEHKLQIDEAGIIPGWVGYNYPSYSCVLLLVHLKHDRRVTSSAFMRIYLQVPNEGTEVEPSRTRAQQACEFIPPELKALRQFTRAQSAYTPRLLDYRVGKQDESGLVPHGFMVWMVWEKVPGNQLGDAIGNSVFWQLESEERRQIRVAFEAGYKYTIPRVRNFADKIYRDLLRNGFEPSFGSPKNLAWDAERRPLYFVGFHDCDTTEGEEWTPAEFAVYSLAIPPKSSRWYESEWEEDFSTWEY